MTTIDYNRNVYHLYPDTYDYLPDISSPFTAEDGTEIVLAHLKNDRYALIPVTVENGTPLHYSTRVGNVLGKDQQLLVDRGDFPTLAQTGLHSESELDEKEMITGFPVSLITYIGRPDRFSGAGFMADDEDIISVLKGDNRLVSVLNLTHPQMAKPLFHVWNIILKEIELGNWVRFWDNIQEFFYNGRKVSLEAEGSKGWQISIFQDEIQGNFDFDIRTELSAEEKSFLREHYSSLSDQQFMELENKLSHIHFSEMAPYYIMRYGFYEGHTDYRSDPIAIALIFGSKTLEEIENCFQGALYRILTDHFTHE
ncbi:hypothetical protein EH221_04365 [bacterium]|nr:MAG: hypothetical protein EH221_04365 [bacterium]